MSDNDCKMEFCKVENTRGRFGNNWEFYKDATDVAMLQNRLIFSEDERVADYSEFRRRIMEKFPQITNVLVDECLVVLMKEGKFFMAMADSTELTDGNGELYEFRHRKFREFIDRMFGRDNKERSGE